MSGEKIKYNTRYLIAGVIVTVNKFVQKKGVVLHNVINNLKKKHTSIETEQGKRVIHFPRSAN